MAERFSIQSMKKLSSGRKVSMILKMEFSPWKHVFPKMDTKCVASLSFVSMWTKRTRKLLSIFTFRSSPSLAFCTYWFFKHTILNRPWLTTPIGNIKMIVRVRSVCLLTLPQGWNECFIRALKWSYLLILYPRKPQKKFRKRKINCAIFSLQK